MGLKINKLVRITGTFTGTSTDPILTSNASTGAVDTASASLGPLASGKIWIGSAGNLPVAQTLSGAITVDVSGVATLTPIVDANVNASAGITLTKLAATTASRALVSDGSGFIVPATTTATEIGYVNGVTSAIQTQLNDKQATITGAATSVVSSNLSNSIVVVSDGAGKIASSAVSTTALGYISTLSSAAQTQLNTKLTTSLGSLATGDIVYYNGSNWTNLPRGTNGQALYSTAGSIQWNTPTINGIPVGGTTGQYLAKTSGVDFAVAWTSLTLSKVTDVTASAAEVNILDGVTASTVQLNYLNSTTSNVQSQINSKLSDALAQNAMFIGNSSNVAVQLAAGTSGYVLTSVSGVPTWQPAPGGGSGIVGPGTSTLNAIVRWGDTLGATIEDSSVIIDGSGNVSGATWQSNKIGLAYGGTNADLTATGGAGNYLKQSSVGATVTVGTIPASDIVSGAVLSKADDTNVTLTLGGAPTTSLLSATSLTLGWTGTLAYARLVNGAGLSVVGRSANSSGVQADITAGADFNILRRSGTSIGFGSIDLSQSGAVGASILPVANGGTGSSSGTSWLLASGGTLTGSNTITSTTPSGLNFVSTFTANANNQYAVKLSQAITTRSTASDAFTGLIASPVITTAAASQDITGFTLDANLLHGSGISTVGNLINTTSGCTNGTYTGVSPSSYLNQDGSGAAGSGALFTVVVSGNTVISVTKTTAGSGYRLSDKLTFNGSLFSGSGSCTVLVTAQATSMGTDAASFRIISRVAPFGASTPARLIDLQAYTIAGVQESVFNVNYLGSTAGISLNDFTGAIFTSGINSITVPSARTFNVGATTATGAYSTTGAIIHTATTLNPVADTSRIRNLITVVSGAASIKSTYILDGSVVQTGAPNGKTITGGSGYTNGGYGGVALTGGSGTGATATISVIGAVVSSVSFTGTAATNYQIGDVLTCPAASIGGTGSGWSLTITSLDFNNNVFSSWRSNRTDVDNGGANANKYSSHYDDRTITQNGTAGTNYFVHSEFNPSVTGTPNIYGVLIRPTTALSGFGLATLPKAFVHTGAGSTTIAALRMSSGSQLTTIAAGVADGVFEYNGTHLTFIIGSTRYQLDQQSAGITNSATANELGMSDGTNIVSSGIFKGVSLGDAKFGSGLAGSSRILTADGSATDVGLQFTTKGSGGITFNVGSGVSWGMNTGVFGTQSGSATYTATTGAILQGGTTTEVSTLSTVGSDSSSVTIKSGDPDVAFNTGDVIIKTGTPSGGGLQGAVKIQTNASGKLGVFNVTPAVQQSVNTVLVNNVTSGGSLSTIADFTSLTLYSTDAATIRNNFFRLAEKVLKLETALRNYGLVIN